MLQKELDELRDQEMQGSENTNLGEETPEDKNSVADEARIPYSRFETVHERAIRAEAELELLKQQQAEARNAHQEDENEPPSSWLDLYGDNDESRDAYRKALEIDRQRADRVYQDVQSRLQAEQNQSQAKLENLNNKFTQAEEQLGKEFSEEELIGVMGVMEEFTPKDAQGNFLSELIDPVKAYEIYQMRHKTTDNSRSQARKQVLKTINGGGNSGGNSDLPDYLNDTQFRGSWRSKYGAD